jgi:hypothetical protein
VADSVRLRCCCATSGMCSDGIAPLRGSAAPAVTAPADGGSIAVEISTLHVLAGGLQPEAASVRELAGAARAASSGSTGSALLDGALDRFVSSYTTALDALADATTATAVDVIAAAAEYVATDQRAMGGGRLR